MIANRIPNYLLAEYVVWCGGHRVGHVYARNAAEARVYAPYLYDSLDGRSFHVHLVPLRSKGVSACGPNG